MAAYGWRKDTSVEDGLFADGHRFDFFQAVRLLEILYQDQGRHPPAEGVEPGRELVRFRSSVALEFAPSDVDAIERPGRKGWPAVMTVNFLGLAGTSGPLPHPISETILGRSARKDTAFQDFLDIFNHRLISILYRARKKYRTALHWRAPVPDRRARTVVGWQRDPLQQDPALAGHESPAVRPAFSLVGLGTDEVQERLHVRDRALLLYTGLLARGARSMIGLARMLECHFGWPAAIEPFQGRWYWLSDDQLTVIGASEQAGRAEPGHWRPQNQALGDTAVLGTRVWDQQSGFELRVGPMSFDRFLDFLPLEKPEGEGFRALCALTRFYVGSDLMYRIRLVLEASRVEALTLGGERPARLGWTSWLKSSSVGPPDERVMIEFEEDDSQVILDPEAKPWLATSRH